MRLVRSSTVGVLTHVICRFVDKSWMIRDDAERRVYLELLGSALSHSDWKCVAFALMSSHLHFGMIPGQLELQSWAKRVNSPFARWLNERHKRLGPVFADRPAEWTIRDHQPDLIAYIHNNPVRAKVVEHARDSSWTSHRMYLGLTPPPTWLHVSEGMDICGFDPTRRGAFDNWVGERVRGSRELPDLSALRAAVRTRGGIELGTPTLGDDGIAAPLIRQGDSLLRTPPAPVLGAVAHATGVSEGAVSSRTRRIDVVSARRVYLHAALRLGCNASEAARHIGISPQAASRHLDHALTASQQQLVHQVVGTVSTCAPSPGGEQ